MFVIIDVDNDDDEVWGERGGVDELQVVCTKSLKDLFNVLRIKEHRQSKKNNNVQIQRKFL